MRKEILLTPNSVARGKYSKDIEGLDVKELRTKKTAGISEVENKFFLKLMYSVQRDNREYIISKPKNQVLNDEEILKWKKLCEIETLECKIDKKELFDLIADDHDKTPEGIARFFKTLGCCRISFDTVTRDGVDAVLNAPLISHYYYEKETGIYRIVVAAKLYKYIFDLGLGYSQNALEVLYGLKGVYAQRLYLVLRSWTGTKHDIQFSVAQLRSMLGVENMYPTFNRLETLLKRTIDTINKSGFMDVKIKDKIRKGRSVDSVVFSVIDNEPRNYLQEKIFEEVDESVLWLDYIRVENQNLLERLKQRHFERDFNSPLVRKLFCKAYDKTLNRDNKFSMIQDKKGATNYALFNYIVDGEFLTNELAAEQSLNDGTNKLI